MSGLVGESGAGKTMLGRALMALLPYPGRVTAGRILWKGEDLLKKSEKELRKIRSREIAMVFQDPISALNPLQKIGDQLAEAVLLHQNLQPLRSPGTGRAPDGGCGDPPPGGEHQQFPASIQRRHAPADRDRPGFGQ